MSNGFRCRAATRKCHSGHETAARIDATKHAIHQPDAHQVALDRARKGVTRAKHFRKSPALLSALFSTVRCIKSGLRATSQLWVIRVDSRVPVDVRSASIFGQAPRHSQAVVNPLEGVRLRNLGSIGPAADHAGRKEVRQNTLPFVACNDEAKDSCKFETLREAHHLIARLTPTSR